MIEKLTREMCINALMDLYYEDSFGAVGKSQKSFDIIYQLINAYFYNPFGTKLRKNLRKNSCVL